MGKVSDIGLKSAQHSSAIKNFQACSSEKRQLTLSTAGKSATCLEFQLPRSSPMGDNCLCCKHLRLKGKTIPAASQPPFLGSYKVNSNEHLKPLSPKPAVTRP